MSSYEAILNRMLERFPDWMDKREGSVIYSALAPAAAELNLLYEQLAWALDQVFADTAEREALILRARERGLSPLPAKAARVKGEFTPDTLEIPAGARFNLGVYNYYVDIKIAPGVYELICETKGAISAIGDLIPIDHIPGLETATITEILILGEDEEDTEAFRTRYLNSFASLAFGGNIADYKEKVNEVQGVGGVKVIPHWDGAGTVKLIIISSDYDAPSAELVEYVQTAVDPTVNAGEGYGIAPIGHIVTVEGAVFETVNLSAKLTLETGYSISDVLPAVHEKLDAYFLDLAKEWENLPNVIVRLVSIQALMIAVEHIIDVEDLTLNGLAKNLVIASNAVPKRGDVNATLGS
jgi:uncharacterized phage protein gp47/JayE